MIVYFIAGFSSCKDFAAVIHLCQYLKWRYPGQFHYKKLVTYKACYKAFVQSLCRKFGWKEFVGSPLIWKQLGWSATKGTAEFLGGEDRFQELINEIYGVETYIPCEEKINLAKDEHNFFLEAEKLRNQPHSSGRRVLCIMNAGHPACRPLVTEILLSGRALQKKDGVEIRLVEENEEARIEMEQNLQDVRYFIGESDTGENIIQSVTSLEEGLLNCELLIIMPTAEENEAKSSTLLSSKSLKQKLDSVANVASLAEQDSFPEFPKIESDAKLQDARFCHMRKTMNVWKEFAERLNSLDQTCKVLMFPTNDMCFKLTCLTEFLHAIRAFDVVGITEDLALDKLSQASELSQISKENFLSIPPVWGFIGVQHLVDICGMRWAYKRTLPGGIEHQEDRQMFLHHDSLQPIWDERYTTGVKVVANQVRATVNLINEWFADKPSERRFSAAVLSDGTFNIPSGLYFSQPVTCVNYEWIPCSNHPPPQENIPLDQLYTSILPVLESLQLGGKWNANWLSEQLKNRYQFLEEIEHHAPTPTETFLEQKLTNRERYELKKYLGKRNQLYPAYYNKHFEHIMGTPKFGQDFADEEQEGVNIIWDRVESLEVKTEKIDILVDEYLAQLKVDYDIEEDVADLMDEFEINSGSDELDRENISSSQ